MVVTDSSTVQHWQTMKDPGGVIRRWLQKLSMFPFQVVHRAGKDLVDADFLSRLPNLPAATPSEQEETQEYEPSYPLPPPLAHMQHLISSAPGAKQVQCWQWMTSSSSGGTRRSWRRRTSPRLGCCRHSEKMRCARKS